MDHNTRSGFLVFNVVSQGHSHTSLLPSLRKKNTVTHTAVFFPLQVAVVHNKELILSLKIHQKNSIILVVLYLHSRQRLELASESQTGINASRVKGWKAFQRVNLKVYRRDRGVIHPLNKTPDSPSLIQPTSFFLWKRRTPANLGISQATLQNGTATFLPPGSTFIMWAFHMAGM